MVGGSSIRYRSLPLEQREEIRVGCVLACCRSCLRASLRGRQSIILICLCRVLTATLLTRAPIVHSLQGRLESLQWLFRLLQHRDGLAALDALTPALDTPVHNVEALEHVTTLLSEERDWWLISEPFACPLLLLVMSRKARHTYRSAFSFVRSSPFSLARSSACLLITLLTSLRGTPLSREHVM